MKKIIRNIIFIFCLFTIGILCLTYVSTHKNIEWYCLGLCISGGIISLILAMVFIVYTVYRLDEYLDEYRY